MLCNRAATWVGSICLAVTLVACGGGGGGGGASGTSDGSSPPSGTTGMIPSAATPGTILYADATRLRPLAAGMKWTYRGISSTLRDPTSVLSSQIYSNVVTQEASGSGWVESGTNPDNVGAQVQQVSVSGGAVHLPNVFDPGTGHPISVDFVELRSPVRVNDQYTLLDTRIADGGADLDGDGVNDEVDLAVYVKVIGEEALVLANLRQVKAVRVTTTTLLRVRWSKSGGYSPVITATIDNWYVPDVGLVKHSSDVPSSILDQRLVTTETLVSWDGLTQGIGNLDPTPATTPDGARLKYSSAGVGFGDHALVMSFAGDYEAAGWALSSIDPRGRVTASQSYFTAMSWGAQLFRVGDEARVVANDSDGLKMFSYTATGAPTGAPPVLLRAAPTNIASTNDGTTIVGASNGDVLWLVWVEGRVPPSQDTQLVATPFDAAGHQLAPATVLSSPQADLAVSYLAAAGAPGHLIINWDELPMGRRYAAIDGPSLTPTLHTTAASSIYLQRYPVVTTTGSALLWLDLPGAGPKSLSGIRFDGAGEPLRSNASSVDEEVLSLDWLFNVQSLTVGSSGNPHIDTFEQSYAKLYPDQAVPDWFVAVTELTPGTGPLATDNSAHPLARGTFPYPSRMVSLTGTVLLISEDPGGPVTITPVWRWPQ